MSSSDKLVIAVSTANVNTVKKEYDDLNDSLRNAVMKSCIKSRKSQTGEDPPKSEELVDDNDDDICRTISYLSDVGFDLVKPTDDGKTCLSAAAENGRFTVCELLLKKNANVNEVSKRASSGKSPLEGNIQLLKLLVGAAEDTSLRTLNGTPLHAAVHSGSLEVVKLLLDHGADPFIKNMDGDDVLQYSGINGQNNICEHLIEHYNYPKERVIETYELCGACAITDEENNRKKEGVMLWKKSLKINADRQSLKKSLPSSILALRDHQEFQTLTELEAMETDNVELLLQALLVYHRILGLTHHKLRSALEEYIVFFKLKISFLAMEVTPLDIDVLIDMLQSDVEKHGILSKPALPSLDILVTAHLTSLDNYLCNKFDCYHVKCATFLKLLTFLANEFEKFVNQRFYSKAKPKLLSPNCL